MRQRNRSEVFIKTDFEDWTETEVTLRPGDTVEFVTDINGARTAQAGELYDLNALDGVEKNGHFPDIPIGAVVAKIGAGVPFRIEGTQFSLTVPDAVEGPLSVMINDSDYKDNTGAYAMTIRVRRADVPKKSAPTIEQEEVPPTVRTPSETLASQDSGGMRAKLPAEEKPIIQATGAVVGAEPAFPVTHTLSDGRPGGDPSGTEADTARDAHANHHTGSRPTPLGAGGLSGRTGNSDAGVGRHAPPPRQPETPNNLIPKLGELAVSDAAHFMTAHLTSGHGASRPRVFDAPLALIVEPDAKLPATGVLLTHEQGWYARGITLGNVVQSITLAPGEVTQVAIVSWNRNDAGSSQEQAGQTDNTTATDQTKRSVKAIQDDAMTEIQSGKSSVKSSGSADESGSLKALFLGSDGSNNTGSHITNESSGVRNLSLNENQRINQATLRGSKAARSLRTAAVKEMSQTEGDKITTRVVANYNHAHAMTVLYFEVIEVYEIETRVTAADRLIYLPMEVVNFDAATIARYAGPLAEAARRRGDTALANDIVGWAASNIPSSVALAAASRLELQGLWGGGSIDANVAEKIAFYRTVVPEGYFSLGDVIFTGDGLQAKSETALGGLAIKAVDKDAIAFPIDFELAWIEEFRDDRLTGIASISIWVPVPPPGYVAVGTIVQQGTTKPDRSSIVCVKVSLATNGVLKDPVWRSNKDRHQNVCEAYINAMPVWECPLRFTVSVVGDQVIPANSHYLAADPSPSAATPSLSAIAEKLNREQLWYNQALWLALKPADLIASLRNVRWPEHAEKALSELVDPNPVTICGNRVGYRWRFESVAEQDNFEVEYLDVSAGGTSASHGLSIAVPTGGIFAEAVLGSSISAEKIDLTRFWKWQDSPIPILPSQISPINADSRAKSTNLDPTLPQPTSAKLDPIVNLPDPEGFSAVSQMMTSNIFRDMSGSSVIKELALAASEHSAKGADNAAQLASKNLSNFMGLVKDIAQMSMQRGGVDSTTMGGMQNGSGDDDEGALATGLEDGMEAAEDVPFA